MVFTLRRWRAHSYDGLVAASRARERRDIVEAIERLATKPRIVVLSPSLARRVCRTPAEPGAQLAGVPVAIDPLLEAFTFKVY